MLVKRSALIVATFGVAAMGCVSYYQSKTSTSELNFARMSTYKWLNEDVPKFDDPRIQADLLHARVTGAVEAQFKTLGFEKIESGKPDFLVAYYAALKDKTDLAAMDEYYGDRSKILYTFEEYRAAGYGEGTKFAYVKGTLIIDILEPGTRNLMWRGSAQARVNQNPEDNAEIVIRAVKDILEHLPAR